MTTTRIAFIGFVGGAALAALMSIGLAGPARAAALNVVTPGEQNTQSGENGCAKAPCAAGHWLHYPELLGVALGAGYVVHNDGDGGAVLGCDAATAAVAGSGSFCKSTQYASSIKPPPDIVIIGPFGEHDQRIVTASAANQTNLYMQSVFEGAYEGLVQKYLAFTKRIFVMTPIDVPWGGTPNLPAGKNLVKDIMLPAAKKVAQDHGLTVIDTYAAISAAMYSPVDGQVNAAGQQKMADLIIAALKDSGGNGDGGVDGGSSDAGAKSDAADGGGAGGTTGTGGAVGSGGASGSGGADGSGGVTGATGGSTGSTGSGGSSSTGAGGSSGTGGAPGTSGGSSSGGGCSVASGGADSGRLLLAGAMLVALALLRARRGRRRAGG